MQVEGETLTIGGWHVAEDISEWIEIVAIAVITIGVLTAFVVGARTIRTLGVSAAVEQIKQTVGRGLLLGLDLLIAARGASHRASFERQLNRCRSRCTRAQRSWSAPLAPSRRLT